MKHISLAFAGVVAGSLALSAQADTTWWSEDFSDYSLDITAMTNVFTKGTWTMREGDTSYLAASYSNSVDEVLVLNTEGQDLTFAPTNATPASDVTVVDADVFFVGSDASPNLSEDPTVQFAMYLNVPDETAGNNASNSVMVYVNPELEGAEWVALDNTDIADKSWHHVQVRITYPETGNRTVSVWIDGTEKTPGGGYVIANGGDDAPGLSSVSFKGTGAVDNFTGGFVVADAAPTHTFTAAAYVDGVLDPTTVIAEYAAQAGTAAVFEVPRTVSTKTITNIVVKALETGSDVAYAVTDDGTDFTVTPAGLAFDATDPTAVLITVSTDDAAATGDPTNYLALVVYYGEDTPAPEPTGFAKYFAGAVGDGSAANPWQIPNLAALEALQLAVATEPTLGASNYVQTADIVMTNAWPGIGLKGGKDYVNGGNKNIPAYEEGAFCGTFDGQNHTISNFQMESGTDYGALFNSVNGATISNLKISFKENKLCADSRDGGEDTGAAFVGVARNSTLTNLTALATQEVDTVSASKDMAGIVGYLMAGSTVDSCTNELNVASLKSNGARKSGGIALITQEGSGTATIRNCKNSGMVTLGYAGGYKGGIVGYIGVSTTIVDCENTAAVQLFHFQTGSVTASGTNKGYAGVASNDKSGGVDNLRFATVSGNVATFVADDALALSGSYKVMSSGAAYTFANVGAITFDESLATPTVNPGTGRKVTKSGEGPYTYTAVALATPTVTVNGGANATAAWTVNGTPAAEAPATLTEGDTYEVVYTANAGYEFAEGATTNATGTAGTENIVITISDAVSSAPVAVEIEPEALGDATYTTEADALAAAANATVGASAAVEAALDSTELAAYKDMFEIVPVEDNGEWKLTAALTSAAEAALTTEATDDAGDLVTAGFTGTVEVDATPGFYYSIVWGTGVTNLGNETTRVLAEGDKVTLTFPANAANSGFYKVKISVAPSAVVE